MRKGTSYIQKSNYNIKKNIRNIRIEIIKRKSIV